MTKMYKKGELITCPSCYAIIAELAKDIYYGDKLVSSLFVPDKFQIPCNGEKMECKACGAPYFYNGKFLQVNHKLSNKA